MVHWRQRREIFGSEKYVLPMTLHGACVFGMLVLFDVLAYCQTVLISRMIGYRRRRQER